MIKPFLKWAGGKRALIPVLQQYLPENVQDLTYYEPFLGGGSMLFHLKPKKAFVNDINCNLITTYQQIKDNPEELIAKLKNMKNDKDFFYDVRFAFNYDDKLDPVTRAAYMIYLNMTCFNGLYRLNKKGLFNTPFGKYTNPTICNEETLRDDSEFFNSSNIVFSCGSYKDLLKGIKEDSFVYFDPPYYPINEEKKNFTSYSSQEFLKNEQIELRDTCDELNAKGIKFMLSNSNSDFIKEIYEGYTIREVDFKHRISVNPETRQVKELIVTNY